MYICNKYTDVESRLVSWLISRLKSNLIFNFLFSIKLNCYLYSSVVAFFSAVVRSAVHNVPVRLPVPQVITLLISHRGHYDLLASNLPISSQGILFRSILFSLDFSVLLNEEHVIIIIGSYFLKVILLSLVTKNHIVLMAV